MKRISVALMFLLFVVIATPTQSTADSKVLKTLADYDAAWNRKDVAAVSRVLTGDYVYFSSVGGLTDRNATLQFLGRSDYKLTFVERSEIKIVSRGDGVAIVSSRWKGKGAFGKEPIDDDQRCGLVFVRRENVWRLMSEHCAQIVGK